MKLHSRKKSRRDRVMCLNSFKTQERKEISRKEAGESRDFPTLRKRIIDKDFQMEEKECEKLNCKEED